MTDPAGNPRRHALGYHVLRLCERMQISEAEFYLACRERQLRLLAYELLREAEERR